MALALLFFVWISPPLLAQQQRSVELYRVKIVAKAGWQAKGILYAVTDSLILFTYAEADRFGELTVKSGNVALTQVRKVVLHRNNRVSGALKGALVGAVATTFVTVRSLQKNPPRSSVFYGINLVMAASGGGGVGALIGSFFDNSGQGVIRPDNRGDGVETLRTQLIPFTYQYQVNIMNRIPKKVIPY
ncbi:MAG: hypothetical protein LH606_02180 [Cytophagaceae bacterium]|nr:hypothetical protein [Cytophagaceae bacterium]